MQPDPLRAERSAFLDASAAAANAVEGLAGLDFDRPQCRDETRALLNAVRLVAEKVTDALAALDKVLTRSTELGIDQDAVADLRRGRLALAEGLGVALQQVERAERLVEHLTDG